MSQLTQHLNSEAICISMMKMQDDVISVPNSHRSTAESPYACRQCNDVSRKADFGREGRKEYIKRRKAI